MRMAFYTPVLAVIFLVTACATTSPPAVHAPKPPPDFVYIGSGDTSQDKDIKININTELMESGDPDHKLTLFFGLLFAGSLSDPEKTGSGTTGAGRSYDDPFVFSGVADDAELDALANYLATHFPDRDDIIGHLYRSPAQRYVVWTLFETRAGSNALYFDVTKWAAVKRQAYGG